MPTYYVAVHFIGVDLDESGLADRLSRTKELLSEYQPRAFGSPDHFVVGAVFTADDEEGATNEWYLIVDPALDKADLGLDHKHFRGYPQVFKRGQE
jgi:hypothetical protein